MTSLVKVASVVAVAGTAVTGGVYLSTDLFKSKEVVKKVSISSLLQKFNPEKRLITTKVVGDDEWKRAYKAYRDENKDNKKDVWGLEGWVKPVIPVTLIETTVEFISKCNFNSQIEVIGTDDLLYQQVLAYCTRDTLVEDWIKESGRSLLQKGNGESQEWKNLWTKYRKSNKNKEVKGDEWGLSNASWTDENINEVQAPSEFMTRCENESKVKTGDPKSASVVSVTSYCLS